MSDWEGKLLKAGFVEWLHFGRFDHAEQILADMRDLSTTQLRTGISWADCHAPDEITWYEGHYHFGIKDHLGEPKFV